MRSLQVYVSLAVLSSCCFHIDRARAEPRPVAPVTFYRPRESAHLQSWHLLAQLHSNAYDISHDTSKIQLPGKTVMMYYESIGNSNVECAFVDITTCRNMGRKHWK